MQLPVGRDVEREAVATVLAIGASGTAVLTIEGDPGIGKTTISRHAAALAAAAGAIVLACQPSEAETPLSFAALTDLLATVPTDALEELAAPQRHALAVVSLREPAPSEPLEARAVSSAFASLLPSLAGRKPLVLLIDDAQWLDQATLDTVLFALRRVQTGIRLALLVSGRTGSGRAEEIAAAVAAPLSRQRIVLSGLSSAALFHIVRDQLDVTLARPALVRVAELSEGNPFIAVELARNGAAAAVKVPGLASGRIAGMSVRARTALLAIASAPRPTLALLESLGLRDAFDEAEASGVVSITGGRISFSHPLLAAAAMELASPAERRDVHARLATLSADPETLALHLALSTPEPDERVAAALSDAVEFAVTRGAMAAAVDHARLALARSVDPTSVEAWERRVRLAELVYAAGDAAEAALLLADLEASCPAGPHCARGWMTMTQIEHQTSTTTRARAAAIRAIDASGTDAFLRVQALLQLSALSESPDERVERAATARTVMEEASLDDVGIVAWVLLEHVHARFDSGHGLDRRALDDALACERSVPNPPAEGQVASVRPVLLKWADEPAAALDALHDLRSRAELEGNEGLVPYALSHIPGALMRLGRFAEALAAADEHLYYAEATGQVGQRIQAVVNLAFANAHLGNLEAAEHGALELLEWARKNDGEMEAAGANILAFTALSVDDAPRARQWYERYELTLGAQTSLDPGVNRYHGDLIETLIATGSLEEAAERTATLAERAQRAARISAAAVASRCAALLAASSGDHEGAVGHLDVALARHAEIDAPFDEARTLMVRGMVHRRAKEKRAAGEALAAAKAAFDSMGAAAWSARAEAELGRNGRRPARSLDLTETERRIALLVASGLTNRQVAEQAFISPKTVEANLAKVYRKLGISSRAELGARMASTQE